MSLACLAHVNFLLHMYFDLITEQINDDDDDDVVPLAKYWGTCPPTPGIATHAGEVRYTVFIDHELASTVCIGWFLQMMQQVVWRDLQSQLQRR